MKIPFPPSLLLVVLFVAGSPVSAADPRNPDILEDPQAAARVFYSELRRLGLRALPTPEEWLPFAPRVTESLDGAIRGAQKEQADFRKNVPDEKPPWVDGDLFSSLFEGPKTFKVGVAKVRGDLAEVPVECVHTEAGDTVTWTDLLVLKKTEKGWLVDDLRYGGTWNFAAVGTLKQSLAPED